MTVIPTYSPNDVMDAGSLRALVMELHDKQLRGEITRDVFLFLNTDADSFLWEPMAVPQPLQKLPCFGGIGSYIDEVADLDFVRFDTPGGYLEAHAPAADVSFGEDVADGNLSGYMSWSEKPFNRLIWSRLERARAMARLSERDSASPSFETRVRLLSTTHFGLASPVMNVTREQKAMELSAAMLAQETAALPSCETLTLRDTTRAGLAAVQLSLKEGFCSDVSKLRFAAEGLAHWCACETGRHDDGSVASVYLVARFDPPREDYPLTVTLGEAAPPRQNAPVAGALSLDLSEPPPCLRWADGRTAQLRSWIEYGGAQEFFRLPTREPLPLAGKGEGVRLRGEIHLPGEQTPGSYVFDFFTTPAADCIFVRSAVQYPYTTEDHEISSQASNLGRYSDPRWKQAAPFELTLPFSDGVAVTKRSFARALSRYPMADFWNAYPQNANICSINHQLTGGTLCIADEHGGLLLAHARQVLGSMAHCPLRLKTSAGRRWVSVNPFGTYFGPQRYYPSRGNGSSMELYLAAAPQARSLAPSYNGAFEQNVQALFGVAGDTPSEAQQRCAEAIADGVVVLGGGTVHAFNGDNVRLHDPVDNHVDPKALKSVTFVEQLGGVKPLLGLVGHYASNLLHAQWELRKREHKKGAP